MNRQIQRLAGIFDGIGGDDPRWDDPVGDVDRAMDRFIALAQELGPGGGLPALGAAIRPRRRPSLYRYSVRAASRAGGKHDPDRCRAALAAAVIAVCDEDDARELMIDLTPHHVAATRVTGAATALFDWAADRAPSGIAETLRSFGARNDVTLEAFLWKEVVGPSGTWFVPSTGTWSVP
jgi:hypothetical protein